METLLSDEVNPMPALPWTTTITPDPSRTYTAFATKLPLTGHRHVPGFLLDTQRIRTQLRHTPGLVGYSMLAEPARKTFWTVSVWEDDASLRTFAESDPHRSSMRRVPARMGESEFRPFEVSGADVPLRWRDVKARLA